MKLIRRKAYVCVYCEGVYADEPVTSCDCVNGPPSFHEGEITYFTPDAPPAPTEPPAPQHPA